MIDLTKKVLCPLTKGKHNGILTDYEVKTYNEGETNQKQGLVLKMEIDENKRPFTTVLFITDFFFNNLRDKYNELYQNEYTLGEALNYIIENKKSFDFWLIDVIKDGHLYPNTVRFQEPKPEELTI